MQSFSTIWNRVILLVAGFIVGWNLSNYWTAAPKDVPHLRTRLWIGAVLGVVLLIWIAIDDPVAAFYGIFIVLFTAFVAYMGSAREASGTPEPWPRPRPLRKAALHDEILVVLVSQGEPSTYEGPAPWAWHLSWLAQQGQKVPSWLARPRAYARIRQAFAKGTEQNNLDVWVTNLQTALSSDLGDTFTCIKGYEFVKPGLASTLAHAAEDGYTRFILVPLGSIDEAMISAGIKQSRIKEVGVQVMTVHSERSLGWDRVFAIERLQQLMQGQLASVPSASPQEVSSSLAELVRTEASHRGWNARVEGDSPSLETH